MSVGRRHGDPGYDTIAGLLEREPAARAEVSPFAAIAVILVPGETGRELLLIERAQREGDPWSGHMALPGGRLDPSDADLMSAAIREVSEETGIRVEPAHLLGELDDVRPLKNPSAGGFAVRPFVFGLEARPELALNHEVASALWVPLLELDARACDAEVEYRGNALTVPAYRCGPHTVWGLTHRVLCGFLERLGKSFLADQSSMKR